MPRQKVNFSLSDDELLIKLVKKYKHIIENKKTDSVTNSKKDETWETIVGEFNSSADYVRDKKQLKGKWENLKKGTKRKAAVEKCSRIGTGDGPSREGKFTRIDRKIFNILGFPADFCDDTDRYLRDQIPGDVSELAQIKNQTTRKSSDDTDHYMRERMPGDVSDLVQIKIETSRESDGDTDHYIRDQMPGDVSNLVQIKMETIQESGGDSNRYIRDQLPEDVPELIQTKEELIAYQKECLKAEHKCRMKVLESEQEENTKFVAYKMQCFKAEHEIRMKILEAELEEKRLRLERNLS